jgi:predicted AlkP superfamily phosphohydrolase/phosphomutase
VQSTSPELGKDQPVFVIGLDGATFDLLLPWMEEQRLPHLAEIWRKGTHGQLRSTIPPVTAPAWASFQTGKNPGKHGLFHFTRYQQGSYETPIVDASSIRSRTIWRILSDYGKRVGLINVPLTYPPTPVNGFMISGMLTPEPSKGFYPPELYHELASQVGEYRIFVPVRTRDYLDVQGFVKAVTQLAEKRAQAALYMLSKGKWDFFMVHFQSTDILQHSLWSHLDPGHPGFLTHGRQERECVRGFYERLDALLGDLVQQMDQRGILILMSDHGFGPALRRVYLNSWLVNQGLMAASWGPVRRRALQVAESIVRSADLLRIRRRIIKPRSRSERLVNHLTRDMLIDWDHTKAFALSGPVYGRVYVNCRGREARGVVEPGTPKEALRDEIAGALLEFRDPDTGAKVIKNVFKREDIYHGEMLEIMPDLVVEPTDGYMITTAFGGGKLVERVPRFMTGTHRMNGTLMLRGEPFLKGSQIENAQIMDMAPTILYLMGVPIPTDMDGRVLREAILPSYLNEHPVQYEEATTSTGAEPRDTYSPDETEEVRERLRGLGYLS